MEPSRLPTWLRLSNVVASYLQGEASLRRGLFLPIVLTGLVVALLMAAIFYLRVTDNFERQARDEARGMVNTIARLGPTISTLEQLRRTVASTAAERHVELILVVGGNPRRVLASSRGVLDGRLVADLPDPELGRSLDMPLDRNAGGAQVRQLPDSLRFDSGVRFALLNLEQGPEVSVDALVRLDRREDRALGVFAAQRGFIAVLLAGAVLVGLGLLLISRRVTGPLDSIVSAINQRGAGQLDARAPVKRVDEIGRLAQALNRCFDEIDDYAQTREARVAELVQTLNELHSRDEQLAALRQKLELALDASGTVAWECDLVSGEVIFTRGKQSVSAANDGLKTTIETFFERAHEIDRESLALQLAAIRNGSMEKFSTEYRLRQADGTWRWLISKGRVITLDQNGHGLVMAGVNFDITERKSNEAKLREAQKLEAIGQLTGGLAHDFNNLLGIVVGNLDEIGERLPEGDARLRHQHRAATEAALRGAEVTRALLAVARRQPLEVGSYDANLLLAELLPLARSSAGSAVTVRSHFAAGELRARIDAAGLSNAVLNLVINARDAMQGQSGERVITLRTRRVDLAPGADETLGAGCYALLEVADTGSGMSEEVKSQAFEPFFTTKERGQGTGLGLAMVYGFASQLGGTARIQSQPGRGTTVQLYLPMDPEAVVAADAAEALRLAALQAHAILDTDPEAQFDALVREAARVCEVPIALVSLVDEQRQWFKAKVGLQASQTPREQAFCAHAIVDPGGVLVVPDAHRDPRFSANPLVLGEPHVGFYAGVVLHGATGEALGTLCVIDHHPRQLNAVQLGQLAALAKEVSLLIRTRGGPQPAPDVAPPPLARTSTPSAPAPRGQHQRQRVLVVDDEEALCELACDWLESLGYQPSGVHSPAAALERLATERFDILFSDIVMPGGMDGLALAREARSRHPHLRVVLTSGYAQGLNNTPDLPGPLVSKPYRKADLARAFSPS